MTLTFNELRRIKDSLPEGSMRKIAKDLGVSADTVRNYFGGDHFSSGEAVGIHYEPGGPDGGFVKVSDSRIIELAQTMIQETNERGQIAAEQS